MEKQEQPVASEDELNKLDLNDNLKSEKEAEEKVKETKKTVE